MSEPNEGNFATHPFWGKKSALSSLGFLALLIFATGRMAFALIGVAALLWTSFAAKATLVACSKFLAERAFPFVALLIAVFYSNLFLVVLNLYSPILAIESIYLLLLVPVAVNAAGWLDCRPSRSKKAALAESLWTALSASAVFIGLGLLREPFGYGSLSLPGPHGILEFFGSELASSVAVRFVAGSSGALIILGYSFALFRTIRDLLVRSAVQGDAK